MKKIKDSVDDYLRISVPLLIIFISLRIFEYFTSGIKLTFAHSLVGVLVRCFYFDTFTWLLYLIFGFLPFFLLWLYRKKTAINVFLILNHIIIALFFGLLMVFSERLVPFDHEFFVRKASESCSIILQVFTGRFLVTFPLFIYLPLYFLLYRCFFRKRTFPVYGSLFFFSLGIFSVFFMSFSTPALKDYDQIQEYYLVNNKLNYFVKDNISYWKAKSGPALDFTNKDQLKKEIEFYQKNNGFHFVNEEYPLLHLDDSKDVLGNFFRSSDTVPNIVIILFEGLSRDFSGKDAVAGSFTPFLDSLANHSLSWYNFLSNAQGTFGSLPSILGALPFGERGFTLLTDPPEHLTLVKILKRNNWQTYYFTGADMNFDNFGPFMRLQNTDYLSTNFGSKYRKMGAGRDGISAGYPDDALFAKSLEVLDSVHRTPYLSVYLTVTTHTPFVFAQSAQYEKKFEQLMKSRNLPEKERRRLRIYKPLWASFLFTDDCLRNFFRSYQKRKEFANTIFIITGDHHHGFYPTRNEIDDYNVPFIIYSPLLKKSVNFNSVNCHMNVAPTLLAYLKENYNLRYYPRYVSWVTDELDTCRTFRNIHHIPFMLTNRDINDYLDGDYYIGDLLYKLKPGLNLEDSEDKEALAKLSGIRDNFRFINSFVCKNNKVFPAAENIYEAKALLLKTFADTTERDMPQHTVYQSLVKGFNPPLKYRKLMVKIAFKIRYNPAKTELLPHLLTRIYSADHKKEFLASSKTIYEFIHVPENEKHWTSYFDGDMYCLVNYPDTNGHLIDIDFYNHDEIKMKIKDLTINFFGLE